MSSFYSDLKNKGDIKMKSYNGPNSQNVQGEIYVPFHANLRDQDSESQTYGCRHSNPDICGSNQLLGVCALVSDDHICRKPSKAWKKQFNKLSELKKEQVE